MYFTDRPAIADLIERQQLLGRGLAVVVKVLPQTKLVPDLIARVDESILVLVVLAERVEAVQLASDERFRLRHGPAEELAAVLDETFARVVEHQPRVVAARLRPRPWPEAILLQLEDDALL